MLVVSDVLLLAGGLWMVLAALGVLRLHDVFSRIHVGTKATTLGLWLVLLGSAMRLELGDGARLVLVGLLVFITAPVGAHLVGRAVHQEPGTASVRIDTVDELGNADE